MISDIREPPRQTDWKWFLRQYGLEWPETLYSEVKEMANRSIADFKPASDSVSLAKLNNAKFTIVKVEDSNYEDGGQITQGVKITTKEAFDIDGVKISKFHTTRTAIVNKLRDPELRKALEKGDSIGPVRTESVKAKKGGKPYYDLVEA